MKKRYTDQVVLTGFYEIETSLGRKLKVEFVQDEVFPIGGIELRDDEEVRFYYDVI
jgi:hypothetical protein